MDAMVDRVQLLHDWIIVKLDEEPERTVSGLIIKPEGAHENALLTGTVYKTGPGRWATKRHKDGKYRRAPVGVERGQRILFVKFIARTETIKSVRQIIGKEFALLMPRDILLVNAPGQREWFTLDKFNQ